MQQQGHSAALPAVSGLNPADQSELEATDVSTKLSVVPFFGLLLFPHWNCCFSK